MNDKQAKGITIAQIKQALREVLAESRREQMPRQLLSPDQVAEELQIDAQTIRAMCKRGEIKSYKIGKFIRIERRDLDEFIRACDLTA